MKQVPTKQTQAEVSSLVADRLTDTDIVVAKLRGQPFSEIPFDEIAIGDCYLAVMNGQDFVFTVVRVRDNAGPCENRAISAATIFPGTNLWFSEIRRNSPRDRLIYIGRVDVTGEPPEVPLPHSELWTTMAVKDGWFIQKLKTFFKGP